MIYFETGIVKIPRHFKQNLSKIRLINEMTGDVTELDFTDRSSDDRYYQIDLSNLVITNGTYKYVIGREKGLLQIGDFIPEVKEYNEKKTNVVYER